MSNDLPIQEKIEYVKKSKEQIHRSAGLITSYLQKMSLKNTEEDKQLIALLKREIRTINKELSFMSGFCEKKVQNTILDLCQVGAKFSAFQRSAYYLQQRVLIDYWTTQAGSLPLDYNKSPFKLAGGFEINWDIFKAFLKGEYNP